MVVYLKLVLCLHSPQIINLLYKIQSPTYTILMPAFMAYHYKQLRAKLSVKKGGCATRLPIRGWQLELWCPFGAWPQGEMNKTLVI